MALYLSSFVENAMRFPVQPQQMVGNHHARGERGGARSQAFSNGNIVCDLESNRRKLPAHILGYRERGLPDQVVLARRNQAGVTARGPDRQSVGPLKSARQINRKREP